MSVEATLRSLLANEKYVELLLKDQYHPDFIEDFRDCNRYAVHPLTVDTSKFTIALQLFYDGMGTTNPLRGQSSLCSVGVFYYTVKNLPTVFNSCFANVNLLALGYYHDVKVYGFEAILEKFVSEIKNLSSRWFNGNFPIIGSRQIYVTMFQVAGDNLALNGILGFIESFSCDFFAPCVTQLNPRYKLNFVRRISP